MRMPNTLTTRQNSPEAIKQLRAQRYLHDRAKRVVGLQVVLTTFFPIAGTILEMFWPQMKGGVAFYGISISILDIAVLDSWQKRLRKVAVKIQEVFDCSVLDLPWDDVGVGTRPEEEDVHAASSAYRNGQEDATLANWYPAAAGEIPLSLGRIICQRSNLRWDAHLRRRYRTWLAGILLTAGLVISYLGLRNNFSLEQLTLTVLAPIAPMILWGIREFQGNGDAADVSDRLREKSRELWAAAIDGKLSDEVLRARARLLQSEIYARRVNAPLIFNWVYRLLRTAGEEQMNVAANELVREARAHGF
jgi:SMODS-associating 4TM effector domain